MKTIYENILEQAWAVGQGKRGDLSEELASDNCVARASNAVVELLRTILPAYAAACEERAGAGQDQIAEFFRFARDKALVKTAEIVHSVWLLGRVVNAEIAHRGEERSGVVSEASVGTLLLVAMSLAVKMNRDAGIGNGWWAKAVGMSGVVMANSERIFLKRVEYRLTMPREDYALLYEQLVQE
ncbi:MAG: hypothetical protein EZS28_015782 [Streblomastix strix]|uniref:Cyclin N-terminal domain-containing protein n=2 Tax=Streblomastix strix TaxID=222440 RepID=A0A5J4W173_9EUKA|nr:MAG: hypothetical protein EZS28_015782 [Streblomastix strix]